MTMTPSSTRPAAGPVISAHRVGPVITTLAAALSAAVMFGLGVLAGMAVAAILGLHDSARTDVMLGVGTAFALGSVVASARRHLIRR